MLSRSVVSVPTLARSFSALPAAFRPLASSRLASSVQASSQVGFARHLSATSHFKTGKPTVEDARKCPRHYYEMSNEMIIKLAAEGKTDA